MGTGMHRRIEDIRTTTKRDRPTLPHEQMPEPVILPGQEVTPRHPAHDRYLATCLRCDMVVDSELLHPYSGLCPRCHTAWANSG